MICLFKVHQHRLRQGRGHLSVGVRYPDPKDASEHWSSLSQAPSSFCQIALWSKSRSTLGRVETCYTVTEIPRDSRRGAEPRCLPETRFLRRPNPQQRPGAALAALAALAAGRWPHSLTAELGRRGSGPQGGSPSQKEGLWFAHEGPTRKTAPADLAESGGVVDPNVQHPGRTPRPRAPLGSGTVKHLRIMNSQPHTAEAEAAILSGCLPDTRALGPQSWASGSSLRPRRPSVPRAGGST